jgi:type I restriction enzyme M protein
MGAVVDRVYRELSDTEIARIASTYHAWCGDQSAGEYADVPGFCRQTKLDDIRKHGYVLTPGRYVGAETAEEDDEPFEEKMKKLCETLRTQRLTARDLDQDVSAALQEIGFDVN